MLLDHIGDLRSLTGIDERPRSPIVTVQQLIGAASDDKKRRFDDVLEWLLDKRNRKAFPHRFNRAGYVPLRNDGQSDGRWKVRGVNVVLYGDKTLPLKARLDAANDFIRDMHKAMQASKVVRLVNRAG